MAWYLVHDTTFTGTVAAGLAGSTLQDGWIDFSGNVWSISGGSAYPTQAAGSASWQNGVLIRPLAEDAVDSQQMIRFVMPASGNDFWLLSRLNRGTSWNAYGANISANNGSVNFISMVNGTFTFLSPVTTISGLSPGTPYDIQFTVTQTSSTTTTLTAALYNTAGTLLGSQTLTDTTAALQNATGGCGYYLYRGSNTAITSLVTRARVYTDVATFSSGGFSVPASGTIGLPTTFTLAPLWPLNVTTIVTPSSNGDGGTFSPTTLTFPAGSALSQSFTYTPMTSGTKTMSVTNNQSSINPTALSWTVYPASVTMGVTSSAALFSPGNWKGSVGRGGTAYRQAWNTGAWFSYTWNAGPSPTATLLITTSTTTAVTAIYVNGVAYDSIAAPGNLTIVASLLKPNAATRSK